MEQKTVENRQFKEKEDLLRLITQHSDRVICYYNIQEKKTRMWDARMCKKCRLPRMCEMQAQSVLGSGAILPESIEDVRNMFKDVREGKPDGAIKMRVKVPGGGLRWFDFRYSAIQDEDGIPTVALISHKDITEQYEHEIAYLRYVQESESDVEKHLLFVECDLTADRIEKLGGHMLPRKVWMEKSSYSEFSMRMLNQKFLSENREDGINCLSLEKLLEAYHRGEYQLKREWQLRFQDGTMHWVACEIMLLSDPYNDHVKAFCRMQDITEEKQESLAIKKRSERDGMTGLLNRVTAEERVRSMLDGDERSGILVLLDLDDLKGINDTFGHKEGDKAILGISTMLKKHFRDSDVLGRLGGDEFLAYLPGAAENRKAISASITSLLRKLSGISVGTNGERRLHCSVGCAVQTSGTDSYEKLFKQADTALYHVKRSGKNKFAFYVPEMEEADYQFREQKILSMQHMKRFDQMELQHLLHAVAAFYPLVVSANLSANDYYLLEEGRDEIFLQFPAWGALDDFLKMVAEFVHPEDIHSFHENLSIEKFLKAYEIGQTHFRHCFRFFYKEKYLQTEAMSYLYTNENEDVCNLTLIRWT